jgi:electron transfer flavoprotein beta subunit
MNIIVCIKQILDPEIPARDFRVDSAKREAERGSANLVTNIFCENALETALQFREAHGGKITVVSVGPEGAEDVLRKSLALTANEAVLVVYDAPGLADPLFVARTLAAAIRNIGAFDAVLLGREAGDWGAGQTGGLLAEELALPCISFAESLAPAAGGAVQVKRQTDSGWELLESTTPLVVTITNHEKNVLRIPKTRDVMQSYRKPLTKWTLADLGIDPASTAAYYEVAELSIPRKETQCEFIAGDTLEAKIDAFASRLTEVMRAL